LSAEALAVKIAGDVGIDDAERQMRTALRFATGPSSNQMAEMLIAIWKNIARKRLRSAEFWTLAEAIYARTRTDEQGGDSLDPGSYLEIAAELSKGLGRRLGTKTASSRKYCRDTLSRRRFGPPY
jgi:hypothetical protein